MDKNIPSTTKEKNERTLAKVGNNPNIEQHLTNL
jgi:hypothetical protein